MISVLPPITNNNPCCTNQCRDSSRRILSRSPSPGSTVGNTTAVSNAARITFRTRQRLVLFNVTNNGNKIAGTLSIAIGAFGTVFTFTPSAAVAVGTMRAFVVTEDVDRDCQIKTDWSWNVST